MARAGRRHGAGVVLLRVGSRGSRLALTQAEQAVEPLRRQGVEIAFLPMTTAGDRDRTRPFGQIGTRGVFVKELEEALLGGRIDVAVHSAKDMTSTDVGGLVVGAYTRREDARDALCGAEALRPGMRLGTASVRRRAQLLALEPTLSIEPLRGNIDTRLRKRGERGLDAVVLAACGLDRLGLEAEIGHRFSPEEIVPEAGQGALALQVRAGEEALVAAADDSETRRRVEAERRCVSLIGGGCLAPVAAFHDGTSLTALVADEIGRRFAPDELLPEAGQGALAVQVREGEKELVASIDHAETRRRVEAERRCVAAVGGGCLAPVAAHHSGTTLTGLVAAEDGSWIERRTGDDPAALGAELADASTRHA